jgi:hypothetical protein
MGAARCEGNGPCVLVPDGGGGPSGLGLRLLAVCLLSAVLVSFTHFGPINPEAHDAASSVAARQRAVALTTKASKQGGLGMKALRSASPSPSSICR